MEPLVSVIMPNYNGGRHIEKTIQSVLLQTYQNLEFIIVDDASTDNSRDIIRSFSDSRIRLVCKEKNQQICAALNDGIAQAGGRYIARIDSDDKWEPDKLKKQVDFLENNASYDACFTWAKIIDEYDNVTEDEDNFFYRLFKQSNKSRQEWIKQLFFKGNCLCHPSVLVRTAAVKRLGGYKDSLLQLQDYDMWLRLLKLSNIYVIEEELTCYRRIEGDNVSISAGSEANNTRCYNETVYMLNDYLDDMEDELFISCFQDEFVNRASHSKEELACEKAFLCMSSKLEAGREAGILKLAGLSDDEKCRKVLEESFNFGVKDFYKLSGSHYFYDSILRGKNSGDEYNVESSLFYRTNNEQEDCFKETKIYATVNAGAYKCSVDVPADAMQLRFDPVDNKMCIISGFRAFCGERQLECRPINAAVLKDFWFFGTNDPQIEICADGQAAGRIDIKAFIYINALDRFGESMASLEAGLTDLYNRSARTDVLEAANTNLKDMVEAKDNHIFNLENIIASKENEINLKNERIAALEQKINQMENTKVWKLYRRLKKG